jgi:hypothetical protein
VNCEFSNTFLVMLQWQFPLFLFDSVVMHFRNILLTTFHKPYQYVVLDYFTMLHCCLGHILFKWCSLNYNLQSDMNVDSFFCLGLYTTTFQIMLL